MAKATADASAKESKYEVCLRGLEKDYGKGVVMGAKDRPMEVEAISTGSIGIDTALGVGGLPRGRIVEIYGPESSGKTTFCIHVIVEAQKKYPEKMCAIVDAEHAFDMSYAEGLGIDLDRFKIAQPDTGEEALEIARRLAETGEFSVIVVDSVAALVPKAELDGEIGDSRMGGQARLMSQTLRIIKGTVNKSDTLLIFTNQIREKIGVMFGNPETTSGGNSLKFYASVRIDIRRMQTNKVKNDAGDEEAVSNKVKVKIIKNKVAPPFRNAEINILFGEGFDRLAEIIEIGSDLNILQKSGSWFSYENNKLGQGVDNVRQLLKDNEGLAGELEQKVRLALSGGSLQFHPAETVGVTSGTTSNIN